jgi:hypothetical protein
MSATLGSAAKELHRDLGFPSGVTECYISGWMMNNLGRLNNTLGAEYNFVSGEPYPTLNNMALAIYKDLFTEHFYERKERESMIDARYNLMKSFVDEDTHITWNDRTQVVKYYTALKKDTRERINNDARSFKRSFALTQQVVGDDEISEDRETE